MTTASITTEKSKRCPKCQTSLKPALREDAEVDSCPSCQGIWVDLIEERNLVKLKPQVFTIAELKRLRKLYKPLGKTEPVRYVSCPVCGGFMNRINWGSHSGVIVDRCEKHGSWYDEKEAEKIREYVALGGVEYEKYKFAQSGLSDVLYKLDREVTRLDREIGSAYRRARLWSLVGF